MKQIFKSLPLGLILAGWTPMAGQMLVVDRGISSSMPETGVRLGKTQAPGFIGDHFQIGQKGEIWIVDHIRTWTGAGESGERPASLVDVFEKASLFGGIEAPPPEPGRAPEPECDCHNLIPIRSGRLRSGANTAGVPDVHLSNASGGIWQVDFENLRWFVPGGVEIQFGVMGVSPGGGNPWYNQAGKVGGAHQLKAFDEKGKLERLYTIDGAPVDGDFGLNVQVWAHRMAPVKVRSSGTVIEVGLHSDVSFDAAKADAATLRFGPKNATPVGSRLETVDGHAALVARFRLADTGIQGSNVSVCLNGLDQDRVPFEGCDLIAGSVAKTVSSGVPRR